MGKPDEQADRSLQGSPDLYQKAAEIGKDALDDQVSELDSIRGRSVQFLAFVGSATAFLVGTTLDGAVARGWVFGMLGGLGAFGVLILLILLRSMLIGTEDWWRFWGKPLMEWHYRMDPTPLTRWLDLQGARVTAAQFYRTLAEEYRSQKTANDDYLKKLARRYIVFLVLATFELLLWGGLAWFYGRA